MSKILVKTTFSNALLDELCEVLDYSLIKNLSIKFVDKKDFRSIKEIVTSVKKYISDDLYFQLQQELNEIKEDYVWKNSKRGEYILNINEWYETFREDFNSLLKYENVYIGAHENIEAVFVTGKLKKQDDENDLIEFLKNKQPPYKLFVSLI